MSCGVRGNFSFSSAVNFDLSENEKWIDIENFLVEQDVCKSFRPQRLITIIFDAIVR